MDAGTCQIQLPAEEASLLPLWEFVDTAAIRCGIPQEIRQRVHLVLEEISLNIVNHAYPQGAGAIEASCRHVPGEGAFLLTIRDNGRPFNPLAHEPRSPTIPVQELDLGGHGIRLTRAFADGLEYVREGDTNLLTLTFRPRHNPSKDQER